jgi:hypothetical protein
MASAAVALDGGDVAVGALIGHAAAAGVALQPTLERGAARRVLLMRLPPGAEAYRAAVPAVAEDASGRACLLVLPSDRSAARSEAAAVEVLLGQLLADPPSAARRACEWRAAALAGSSAGALAALAAAAKGDGGAARGGWQLRGRPREEGRGATGGVLAAAQTGGGCAALPCHRVAIGIPPHPSLRGGGDVDAAIDGLLHTADAHSSAAAAGISGLLDSKGAAARAGAAAATATEAAAAAAAAAAPGATSGEGGAPATAALRAVCAPPAPSSKVSAPATPQGRPLPEGCSPKGSPGARAGSLVVVPSGAAIQHARACQGLQQAEGCSSPKTAAAGPHAGAPRLRAAAPSPLRLPGGPGGGSSVASPVAAQSPMAAGLSSPAGGTVPAAASSACGQGSCSTRQAAGSPQPTPAGSRLSAVPGAELPSASLPTAPQAPPEGSDAEAAEGDAGGGAEAVLSAHRRLAEMDGLSVGSAVCIADLIRQVGVGGSACDLGGAVLRLACLQTLHL